MVPCARAPSILSIPRGSKKMVVSVNLGGPSLVSLCKGS